MIAAVLTIALAVSMAGTALASPSPAGIELSPSATAPEIRPDTDPNFPPEVGELSTGLCFGRIGIWEMLLATSNVVRNSAADHEAPNGREIGLRVRSAVDFDVQVTLTGFQVGGSNTISGAFKVFTQDGGTPIPANAAAGEATNVNNEWRTVAGSPAVITTYLASNPLMSGTGTTPGPTAIIVRGRGFAGVDILWATNLVGELHMVPGTAVEVGAASATMTWTAIPI